MYRLHFYPRPPRGGRPGVFNAMYTGAEFLSTPSARRATHTSDNTLWSTLHFYPRPPRGGRQRFLTSLVVNLDFYPRPPRGGRHTSCSIGYVTSIFLSTPSARRATGRPGRPISPGGISIHALREEGDMVHHHHPRRGFYFYPRPPRGGRLRPFVFAMTVNLFLSTPSARRATISPL